jgi:hypothetical protein
MKIVTKQTLSTIEHDSNISYVSVPTDLLQSAGITSSDELNIELLPIENESDDIDAKLTFGIIITKKEEWPPQ